MKIPRNLSGSNLIKSLCKYWDYKVVNQESSHVILETNTPSHHRICVPDHYPLKVGTLNSILRAVSQHKKITKRNILDSL